VTLFFCNHIKNQTDIKQIATNFIRKIIACTVFIIIRFWYIFIFEILKHDKKKTALRTIVALVGTQWYILYKSIIYIAVDYNLRRENNWSTIVSELVSKFYYVMECLVYIIYAMVHLEFSRRIPLRNDLLLRYGKTKIPISNIKIDWRSYG